ncbi:MAG: response regulator [Desulfopila sp.]
MTAKQTEVSRKKTVQKKVLLMDDEELVTDIAGQMLAFLGLTVYVVTSGEQAVKEYAAAYGANAPYDFVILDLNIPEGMGGLETIPQILEIDTHAKVIVSSGDPGDPIMQNYAGYGFMASIAKPYDLDGLQKVIETVIG